MGLIAAVLGGGGVLFYRQRQKQLRADTGKTEAESGLIGAQADGIETGKLDAEAGLLDAQTEGEEAKTLGGIISILRGEMDRQAVRLGAIEKRVTALEKENRGLKRIVDNLLNLVRRMWAVIRDNEVDIDPELAGDIYDAIEDSTA